MNRSSFLCESVKIGYIKEETLPIGGAFAPREGFAVGKTLPEAEFTSTERFKFPWYLQKCPHLMVWAFLRCGFISAKENQ